MARQTLGRGLSALLGDGPSAEAPASVAVTEVDIDLIDPNPDQPRTTFEKTTLDELAASIRSNGIVQPILIRPIGNRYQIVAGERRWRAAQLAELRRLPVVIREISDDEVLELALVENIQRQELNPIEEAKAYRKLIDNIGLTQDSVAERVGKDRTVVTTSLRLLRLPNEIQNELEKGTITTGHGRALLMSDDINVQKAILKAIIEQKWSVRETERKIRSYGRDNVTIDNKEVKAVVDPNVKAAENRLMRSLNTKVRIVSNKKGSGGKIEIEYYGPDDLDRLFDKLK